MTPTLAISDAAIIAMITGIPTTLAAIGALVASLRNNRQNAALRVDVGEVKKQADATHDLMNSAKGAMLQTMALDKRHIAILTRDAGGDVAGAEALAVLAEKLYREHMEEQAKLDAEMRAHPDRTPARSTPAPPAAPQ